NMNADLHDKDVIVIQTIETEKRKVSINSASLEELTTLNGIGSATAQKIIDYRTQVRSFQTLEDIMQVKGIKEGLFAKIKDQICL
ncbi:MAG: ComEA family DNA-binding protein, partial [Erysipelotrichia bacterium]|nr:ComEA family DNA-binding protein [Erysipelotrichia bacterium]